jgi:high-affinity iron transporter
MFGTAIIVFREVLEAAIIIGILAAATREVPKRNHWLAAGVLAGLAGSSIVASSTEAIANLASGIGQELFNAIVLGVAVLMLAWHNIWMSSHGKELATNAKKVGKSIVDGMQQSSILLTVVGLAVLREGSETVLFLFGMATTQTASSTITGALAGLGAGAAVGYALYAGLLRVPMRWFFVATSGLVLLLAAGMASNATKFLIQADVLPSLASPLWDTSGIIAQNGIAGTLLHSLIGYDARPAGMQVIVYMAVLLAIWLGMQYANKPKQPFTPMLSGQY